MNQNKNLKKTILFSAIFSFLIILISLSISNTNAPLPEPIPKMEEEEDTIPMMMTPRISGGYHVWNITIDDSGIGGNGTWQELDDNHDLKWLNGSGTFDDPYIIENVTVDGRDISSAIVIRNSTKYFIIQNCTGFSSGSGDDNLAGLQLINVTRGKVMNNNFSKNLQHGIYCYNCFNNTLYNNTIAENGGSGIYLNHDCGNNTIIENNVYAHTGTGSAIFLKDNCTFNNITSNSIENNNLVGLNLNTECHNNTISHNNITSNRNFGIYLYQSKDNTINYNNISKVTNGFADGLYLTDDSDRNEIYNNTIMDNKGSGISIYYYNNPCDTNIIYNNKILNNQEGIEIDNSTSCDIYDNTIYNNTARGIYLKDCDDFTIINNTIYNQSRDGVLLESCNHSKIYNNHLYNNSVEAIAGDRAIALVNTEFINISHNVIEENIEIGVNFIKTNHSFISNNEINLNGDHGISLTINCFNNTLYNNTIVGNEKSGIYFEDECNNNTIIENSLSNHNLGPAIYLFENCDFNNFTGNSIEDNQQIGINLVSYCHNNTISHNNITSNRLFGINLYQSMDNTITYNNISKNTQDATTNGISLHRNSDRNNITNNYIMENSQYGISIDGSTESCDLNTIFNNTISYNQDDGVYIEDCSSNIILNNTIFKGDQNGIYLKGCSETKIYKNIISNNTQSGIYLESCNFVNITDNNISNNTKKGVSILLGQNNTIEWNVINSNDWSGINQSSSHNNTISYNTISTSKLDGIFIYSGANTTVFHNNISFCERVGILLYQSDDNKILNNNVFNISNTAVYNIYSNFTLIQYNHLFNNTLRGIGLNDSNNLNVSDNQIIKNLQIGIEISNCYDCLITLNNISLNTYVGIRIHPCTDINITRNTIEKNVLGIYGTGTQLIVFNNDIKYNTYHGINFKGNYSLFYLNNLTGNGINAIDDDILGSNSWDNGTIGNYWGNYTEVALARDINDDGIGDVDYPIGGEAGVNDTKPIFRDNDDIPIIDLNLPTNESTVYSIFDLNVLADIGDLHRLWYNYSTYEDFLTSGVQEQIMQDVWDALPDQEWAIIEIHANDTAGNERVIYLKIKKALVGPTLTIVYPTTSWWNSPVPIRVRASDPNFHSMWYVCNGKQFSLTNDTLTYLDSDVWAELDNGVFYLDIYAKNTFDVQSHTRLTLYKDTLAPTLLIELMSDKMGYVSEPRVKVTGTDLFFSSMSCVFEGVTYVLANRTLVILNKSAWDDLEDGKYWVAFYATDKAGNLRYYNYTIYKDTVNPIITVSAAEAGDVYDVLNKVNVTITWSINDMTNMSSVEIKLDDGDWIILKWNALNHTFENVTVGAHNVTIRVYDAAGNMAMTTHQFTVEGPGADLTLIFSVVIIAGLAGVIGIIIVFMKKKGIIGRT